MSATEESAATSQSTSRNVSPTGEGRRLDDSSRNGLSSALHGVGAAHQAGGGGDGQTRTRTGVDDDLPSYSVGGLLDNNNMDTEPESTLETLDDEGISGQNMVDIYAPLNNYKTPIHEPWTFSVLEEPSMQVVRVPQGSEDGMEEEELFDGDSTKAASSPSSTPGGRMAEFTEDEGTTSGAFGPPIRGDTPVQFEPPPIDYEDEAVVEITPPEGEPACK